MDESRPRVVGDVQRRLREGEDLLNVVQQSRCGPSVSRRNCHGDVAVDLLLLLGKWVELGDI